MICRLKEAGAEPTGNVFMPKFVLHPQSHGIGRCQSLAMVDDTRPMPVPQQDTCCVISGTDPVGVPILDTHAQLATAGGLCAMCV